MRHLGQGVYEVGVFVGVAAVCVAGLIVVESGNKWAMLLRAGLFVGAVLPALLAWLQGRSSGAAEGALALAALLGFAGQMFRDALRRSQREGSVQAEV